MLEEQKLIGNRLALPQADELLLQVHAVLVCDEAEVAQLADAGHDASPLPRSSRASRGTWGVGWQRTRTALPPRFLATLGMTNLLATSLTTSSERRAASAAS